MNVKKFVGICLKQLRSRVMPRNTSEKANMLINWLTRGQLSPFDTQRSSRGYPKSVNNIQPCPKRWLLMPLACVGARISTTMRTATRERGRGQFQRTRIGLVDKIACTEGLHFSAFHWVCLCVCLSLSVKSHLTSRMSNRVINEHAYLVAYERQKICGDFPETTAFKS